MNSETPNAKPELSTEEIEALVSKRDAPPAPGTVQPYDLVASDKIVRGRMPALDRLNERWVGDFQRDLVERIRQPVAVELQPAQLRAFGEWQASTPVPTSLNVYTIKPWQRNALVAVEGNLLFVLVDQFYGGASHKSAPAARDKLTPMELRLSKIVVHAGGGAGFSDGADRAQSEPRFGRVTERGRCRYAAASHCQRNRRRAEPRDPARGV
jgi:flagellar motor switch protein FliM